VRGTVRSSIRAVWALITSSNRVGPRLLDIALERVEFGRAHRLPCLGPKSGRAMLVPR
jgi:hypothetical protein